MLEWMKHTTTKSKQEQEFDNYCEKYMQKFNESYPVQWGVNYDIQKDIDAIKKCLQTGEKAKAYEYDTSAGQVY